MVTFFNAGRLANYIYQFAAAYGYAKKHGLEFTVPFAERDQKWHPVYFKNLRNPKFNPSLPSISIVEKTHAYHELEFKESWRYDNIVLNGYFQSPMYFDFCIDDIRELTGLKYETEKGVCGLHIRRGDFLQYPNKHILPPPFYYEQAARIIQTTTGIDRVRVYSDDIAWCKENLMDGLEGFRYEFSEGKNELQDFEGLMNCEAIIAAASTFSVLAGTLSTTPDKVVVVPDEVNFFGQEGSELDLSTLYPKHFYKIAY